MGDETCNEAHMVMMENPLSLGAIDGLGFKNVSISSIMEKQLLSVRHSVSLVSLVS